MPKTDSTTVPDGAPAPRDYLKSIKRREKTVRLCLAGDLVAEHEHLEAQLERESRGGFLPTSLGDSSPSAEAAERIRELEAEMDEHTVEFRFRALSRSKWRAMLDEEHKAREGKDESFNLDTFPSALIVACLTDPELTPRQVGDLLDEVSTGQFDVLFGAAFDVNQEASEVPFSVRASAVMRARDSK